MKKSTQKLPLILMLAVIIWFSVAFIIYPIIHVIYESFFENGQITFDAVGKILRSERAMVSIRNSVLTGVVIMVTTTIVGVLQVLLTDYFDLKGASFYRIVYMTPLVFGGLILNNGYLFVYGPNGIVTQLLMKVMPNLDPNWFTGAGAVFFVMTFGCTHQFMIFFRNAIRSLDNNIIDAAQNLGSQSLQILKNVVLPTVRPTLITLIIITFSTGLNAFAAPLMVGGKFQTIAPLILTFSQRPKSRDLAAILSILLGISQIVLLFVMTKNERRGNFMSISKTKVHFSKQQLSNPVLKAVAYVIAWVLVLIHGLPAVMIVLSSFLDTPAIARNRFSFDAMTLEHYTKVFTNPGNVAPLLRSVAYSAVAAVLVVLLILVVVRIVMHHKDNRFIRSLE